MGEFSINGQYSNSGYYNAQSNVTKKAGESYTTGFDTINSPTNVDWKETFGLSLTPAENNDADMFAMAGVPSLDAERVKDISNFATNFETIYNTVDIDGIEETTGAEVAYYTIDAYQTGSAKRYESTGEAVDLLFGAGYTPEEIDAFMYATQQA